MLVGRLYTQVTPKPTCPVPEVLDFVSSMLVGVVASDTSAVPGTFPRFFGDGMVGSIRRIDDG